MVKERISYIDLGAGIMILYMIMIHACSIAFGFELFGIDLEEITDISQLPAGTHAYIDANGIHSKSLRGIFPYLHFLMPWFFYKSGQFFTRREPLALLQKDTKKLLRPLIIWSLIGYVIYVFFCVLDGTFSIRQVTYRVLKTFFLEGYVQFNTPLWYLLTLLGVRQIANIILPEKGDRLYWLQIIAIILFGYILSFLCFCWDFRLKPQWIANGASGLAFFTMGYSLQKYETKYWLWIPCAIAFIACCIWGFSMVNMKSNTLLYECISQCYLLNMPECFAGIVVFNLACRAIAKYLPYVSWPFEKVGVFAMIIYVSHGILYKSIQKILYLYELTELRPYGLWIIVGVYILFLPLLCFLSTKIRN